MKQAHHHRSPGGFTLLEALLALMVFSSAVVALVGAINGIGLASVESRRARMVQVRMESLMLEITRKPDPNQPMGIPVAKEYKVSEGDVIYAVKIAPLELTNKEGNNIPQLIQVRVHATWKDGGRGMEDSAETWMWPPLFAPKLQ